MNRSMIGLIGSTGRTGRHLVSALKAKGAAFRCLVRDTARAAARLGDNVELAAADVDDMDSIEDGLVGCDKLFLLTGHSPIMTLQQIGAIEAAQRAGVTHVVKLSAGDAVTRQDSPAKIGRDHWEIEAFLKTSGLHWTILRPGFFMQNFLDMADTINVQRKVMMPAPADVEVGMIDVRDTADVAAAVLTGDGHHGRVYSLPGTNYTPAGFAATLSRELRVPCPFVEVPMEAAIAGMRASGMPDWLIEQQTTLMEMLAEGAFAASNDEIEKLSGHPARTLIAFARDHAERFRDYADAFKG